ncbi:MAG: GGDEF domain-containing protein, partial [Nitriliruptoraceae bacterium]
AMIDLDHFKEFNDRHGHDGGDAALTRIAEVLQATARESDVVCRYGGEELAVVMVGSDAADAAAAAERMRRSIAHLSHPGNGQAAPALTASFGVAAVPGDATSVEDLIGAADSALYVAKRAGRDRVERSSRSAGS